MLAPGASARRRGNQPTSPPPAGCDHIPELLLCTHMFSKKWMFSFHVFIAAAPARGAVQGRHSPSVVGLGKRVRCLPELPRSAPGVILACTCVRSLQAPKGPLPTFHEACNLACLVQYLDRYRGLSLASTPAEPLCKLAFHAALKSLLTTQTISATISVSSSA